jgi:hypothetical protein
MKDESTKRDKLSRNDKYARVIKHEMIELMRGLKAQIYPRSDVADAA